jgi:hypothetical protein
VTASHIEDVSILLFLKENESVFSPLSIDCKYISKLEYNVIFLTKIEEIKELDFEPFRNRYLLIVGCSITSRLLTFLALHEKRKETIKQKKVYKSSIQAMPEGVFCCSKAEHRLDVCADGTLSSWSPWVLVEETSVEIFYIYFPIK